MAFLQIMILIAIGVAVREHWTRLTGDTPATRRLLGRWAFRGIVIPAACWSVINLGVFESFPAIVPEISVAQGTDAPWIGRWMAWSIKGAGYIAITWGAITYTWMAFIIARRAGSEPEYKVTAAVVGIPMFCLALIFSLAGAGMLPIALVTVFFPLVHCTAHRGEKTEPMVSYARAEGQLKFGKYEDAELEVITQLEKKENDFQGWLMLAELYATKYKRLEDAAKVVVDLCNDPSVKEIEVSLACHRLADWQLDIGQNPTAARAALDLLIQRFPGSHLAEMAVKRQKTIPRSREDLLDRKKPRPIRLPALRETKESPIAARPTDPAAKREATLEANRMTARLEADPNDIEARERLAMILAEKLGQVSLGIDQLQLLINFRDLHAESYAKWLAQIAEWERHLRKDEKKFRTILAEIIEKYPTTSFALAAKRQLHLLEQEAFEKATASAEKPAIPSIRLQVPKS